MKICINEKTFDGSPKQIVEALRGLLLDPSIAPTNEAYVLHIKKAYEFITGEQMKLPDADLDKRIRAMFRELGAMGFMEVLSDE